VEKVEEVEKVKVNKWSSRKVLRFGSQCDAAIRVFAPADRLRKTNFSTSSLEHFYFFHLFHLFHFFHFFHFST
jgi:hypothetical protein